MLPAKRTHYRRGLALGLTLAEMFVVIVFVLLLAAALLLGRTRRERDEARAERVIAERMLGGELSWAEADAWFEETRRLRAELDSVQYEAEQATRERAAAEARIAEVRAMLEESDSASVERRLELAEQIDQLRDSLSRAEQSEREHRTRADSLEALSKELGQQANAVADALAASGELSPDEAARVAREAGRAEELDRQRQSQEETIAALHEQLVRTTLERDSLDDHARGLKHTVDEAAARIAEATEFTAEEAGAMLDDATRAAEFRRQRDSVRDELVGLADELRDSVRIERQARRLLEDELEAFGIGIDPPPCWRDQYDDPEHILRVELTDVGLRVFHIAPRHRRTDGAMRYVGRLEDGQEYAPEEFLALTREIYDLGVRRTEEFGSKGCRYWVQPIDATGQRKDVFRQRERQLARRFWFHWPDSREE